MLDRREIVKGVEKVYDHPRDVLEDEDLSRADKIRVLESWKSDLLQLQRASEENMPSAEPQAGATADRLKAVVEALEALEET